MMRRIEIIAECGINHNGNINTAEKMIWNAKLRGADVAKFQLFNAERLVEEINPTLPDINKYWVLRTELTKDDLVRLSSYCNSHGIEFMCSVFEPDLVDWLEEINIKRYKVPRFLSTNKALLSKIFSTNKKVLISKDDKFLYWGYPKISWLYCISNYPTYPEDLNFSHDMFYLYYDGFSDHTMGIEAAAFAMSLGASIIEKHVTLDRYMEGPDHQVSATFSELEDLCKFRDYAEILLCGE